MKRKRKVLLGCAMKKNVLIIVYYCQSVTCVGVLHFFLHMKKKSDFSFSKLAHLYSGQ